MVVNNPPVKALGGGIWRGALRFPYDNSVIYQYSNASFIPVEPHEAVAEVSRIGNV